MSQSSTRPAHIMPYILPFGVFALFTYSVPLFNIGNGFVYPLKTIGVALALAWCWKSYKDEIRFVFSWEAVLSGVLVFVVWILLDDNYPHLGKTAFNPYEEASGSFVYPVIAFRLIGASLVVPLMEEIFWRSFAMRFVMDANFKKVPLGQFSWLSFILIAVAFGLAHHRWLAGIFAGLVYAGILCRSKNLFVPILSHAVTNLLLGIYVLTTEQWSYW